MSRSASIVLPRILRGPSAADYAGYTTEKAFLRAVAIGEMPPPFVHAGADAWDRVEIDDAIDVLKSVTHRKFSWQERGAQRV